MKVCYNIDFFLIHTMLLVIVFNKYLQIHVLCILILVCDMKCQYCIYNVVDKLLCIKHFRVLKFFHIDKSKQSIFTVSKVIFLL